MIETTGICEVIVLYNVLSIHIVHNERINIKTVRFVTMNNTNF